MKRYSEIKKLIEIRLPLLCISHKSAANGSFFSYRLKGLLYRLRFSSLLFRKTLFQRFLSVRVETEIYLIFKVFKFHL